jgi:hypothetical protein
MWDEHGRELWTTAEAAAHHGIRPQTWSSYRARYPATTPSPITPRRGAGDRYVADEVRAWTRPGQGTRTDLRNDRPSDQNPQPPSLEAAMPTAPSDLAHQAALVVQLTGLDLAEVEAFIAAAAAYDQAMTSNQVPPTTAQATLPGLRDLIITLENRRNATAAFQTALARYAAHIDSRQG